LISSRIWPTLGRRRFGTERRPNLGLTIPLLFVAVLGITGCERPPEGTTDYELELAQIQTRLQEADGRDDRLVWEAHLFYRRASLTRDRADFQQAEAAISNALAQSGAREDLHFLQACLHYQLHRVPDARAALKKLSFIAGTPTFLALKADIDFEDGRYSEARSGYLQAIAADSTWDKLARLAHLESEFGNTAAAEDLYVRAQDKITVKEMRGYAFVELQRGLLDFHHGDLDAAMDHYRRADSAYSGFWVIEEHIAELLAAQKNFGPATALYEKVIANTERPEFQQALGDLYLAMGNADEARLWYERALSGYLSSAERGEVQYFHHLAEFYSDVRRDGTEAERWARKDLELRQGFAAYEALAWALYRAGRFEEALAAIETALESGSENAELLYHAAMIHQANDHAEKARQLLAQSAAINPRLSSNREGADRGEER